MFSSFPSKIVMYDLVRLGNRMVGKLDVDSLRALKAVADLGGVTKASNFLSLSQSAVSHKIRRLENSIERNLLRRQPGAPLLTNDGERLLSYAERILSLHDEAMSSLGRKSLKGKIRLGITEDTTSSGLARILARFARLYPSVAVRTHVAQSLALDQELATGQIDLAVMQVFERDIKANDVVLGRDDLIWVQSSDFDLPDDRPVPFIAFDCECFYRQWAFREAKRCGIEIDTVLECASIDGVCSAVEAGLGVALINKHYFRQGMRVVQRHLPTPPSIAYVVRSRPNATKVTTAVEVLIAAVSAEFSPTGIE